MKKFLAALVFLLACLFVSPMIQSPVLAEGSREIIANGGHRALSEWRSSNYANLLLRRTFYQVYAQAGEVILMGSSGISLGTADIVLYAPGKINSFADTQLPAASLPPSDFQCNTYRTVTGNAAAGMLTTRAQELAGPAPATGGYTPCVYNVTATGIYWVAMYGPNGPTNDADGGNPGLANTPLIDATQGSGVSMWDITVRSSTASTTDINGRVSADYLALYTTNNGAAYQMDSILYALGKDGYKYKVSLNGVDPNGFIIFGNRLGYLNPDGVTPLYHDLYDGVNNQLTAPQGGVTLAPPSSRFFFNPPSADLPASIAPTPVAPTLTNISFVGSANVSNAYYTRGGVFTFTGSAGGITQVVISRDGVSFDPTLTTNRVLRAETAAGTRQMTWDGNDNSGNPFPVGNGYKYQITLHGGEFHFPLLDAENSVSGGPIITMLNPPGGNCNVMNFGCTTAFYDDRGYRTSNGSIVGTVGAVLPGNVGDNPPTIINSDPLLGFDSSGTQRAYGGTNANGFGDKKGLDLWTYYPSTTLASTLNVIAQSAQADLSMVKSHTGDFTIGANNSFNLVVSNVGGAAFIGTVTVTDTLPIGIVPTSASGTGWTCPAPSGQSISCTNSSGVAIGASLPTITLNVSIPQTTPSGTLTNTATITNSDTDANNNSFTDTVNVVAASDLGVTKTPSLNYPAHNGTEIFTVVITNYGPTNATNVALTDLLPSGLSYVSSTPSQGTYTSGTGAWNVGALANGVSATLTIKATVTAAAGTAITNTTSGLTATQPDPVWSNNSASATITVGGDLGITKSHVGNFTSGSNGSYSLAVANTGSVAVSGQVTVVDTLMPGLTYISAMGTNWTCNAVLQVVTCTNPNDSPNLPVGASLGAITLTVSIGQTLPPQTFDNLATITSPSDTQPANDVSTDHTILVASADLAITKTDGMTSVNAGNATTYTIVVTNSGPSEADNAIFKDPAVSNLSVTGVTCVSASGGAACPTSGNTTVALMQGAGIVIPTLPSFTSVTFSVTGTAGASGSIVNVAAITAPSGVIDSNLANNSATDTDTINPDADLSVLNNDYVTSVNTDTSTTYHLYLSNHGPSAANNTTISDPAAAGLSKTSIGTCYTDGSADCPTEGSGAGQLNIANLEAGTVVIPTLPAGSGIDFTVTAYVTATGGSVTNTFSATPPSGVTDSDLANNSASDTDTVNTFADLAITNTDGVASVNAGSPTTYTIVVTNSGPSEANNAIFKDPAVSNLSVTGVTCGSASGGAACPTSGNTTVALMQGAGILIPTLPSGGSVTFSVTGTAGASGSIANVAAITTPSGVIDTNLVNNSATDTDTINPAADLAVTNTDGVTSVNTGSTTTYTLTLTNNGPSAADGSTISDPSTAGLNKTAIGTCTASGGAVCPTVGGSAGQMNLNNLKNGTVVVPTLPSGGSISFTVTASVTASGGSVTNTFSATPPSGVTDLNLANNSATDKDYVGADLSIAISHTDTFYIGGSAAYSIVVADAGTSNAIGSVTVHDTLPDGLSYVSATGTGWSCSAVGQAVTCTNPNTSGLTQGATLGTITLAVNISPSLPSGTILSDTAMVNFSGDFNLSNNTSTDPAPLIDSADPGVVKTVSTPGALPGDTITYTLVVTNHGPSDATGVHLTDLLPSGINFVSYTATLGSYSHTTGLWTIGDLTNGADATLTITATIDTSVTPGTVITNTADGLAADQHDPNGSNNASSAGITAEPPVDIGVVVTSGQTHYFPGQIITYTITVTNYGPTTPLSSIQLVPQIPSQLSGATFNYTPSSGSYDPVSHTWSGLTFAQGNTITLTAAVTVPTNASGTMTYGVTVSPNGAIDTFLPNNSSSIDEDPPTTAVEMTSFKATWQKNSGVVLSWTTVQETNTIGFNIYRRANGQGDWTLVNASPISSQAPGSLSGADYTFADPVTESKVWYEYKVDCINTGSAVSASLSTTVFTDPYQMFLPQIVH